MVVVTLVWTWFFLSIIGFNTNYSYGLQRFSKVSLLCFIKMVNWLVIGQLFWLARITWSVNKQFYFDGGFSCRDRRHQLMSDPRGIDALNLPRGEVSVEDMRLCHKWLSVTSVTMLRFHVANSSQLVDLTSARDAHNCCWERSRVDDCSICCRFPPPRRFDTKSGWQVDLSIYLNKYVTINLGVKLYTRI